MKNLNTLFIAIAFFTGSAVMAQTQPAKPAQFAAYAERINCTEAQLNALINLAENSTAVLTLSGGFEFRGVVQSSVQKYANLKTAIIRSTNFPGATLSLSLRTDANNQSQFVGRILSFQHNDVYELQWDNGVYVFQKKKFDNLVHTCNRQ